MAGKGAIPPAEAEGGGQMTRRGIDFATLRVELRRMSRGHLLMVAERAVELVPRARLPRLVGDLLRVEAPRKRRVGSAPLLDEVRTFHEANLRGEYYDSFSVNSKNFTQKSEGTEAFIAEF